MKKNEASCFSYNELLSPKIKRIMKLTFLMLTLACLQVSARTYSQNISLKMYTVELKRILINIEKKSEYRFLFDESVLKGKPKVSIEVENADINEVLSKVFDNTGIGYQIMNTNLIVLKQENSLTINA